MISCIIIEEDPLFREELEAHTLKIPWLDVLAVFERSTLAIDMLNEGGIDLVLCDTQMSGINGLALIKYYPNSLFIFITDHSDDAVECFELNVLDYILKPMHIDRLLKAISKSRIVIENKIAGSRQKDFFIVKDRSLNVIIGYNEIYYLKSDKDYTKIITAEKEYVTWKKISDIEKLLSHNRQFLRVQRSYIVNLDFARAVNANCIKMKTNVDDVPIGKHYRHALYSRLGILGMK